MALDSLFTFEKILPENADSKTQQILNSAKKRIGYIPNIYEFMANSPGMLETYTVGDMAYRHKSIFTNVEKEIVYLTISRINNCRYCVAVHSTLADMFKIPDNITEAIRENKKCPHEKYGALIEFTKKMINSHGQPLPDEVKAFFSAGYTQQYILDIIHAIAIKTISNYSNHLFNTPVDTVFKSRVLVDAE